MSTQDKNIQQLEEDAQRAILQKIPEMLNATPLPGTAPGYTVLCLVEAYNGLRLAKMSGTAGVPKS